MHPPCSFVTKCAFGMILGSSNADSFFHILFTTAFSQDGYIAKRIHLATLRICAMVSSVSKSIVDIKSLKTDLLRLAFQRKDASRWWYEERKR